MITFLLNDRIVQTSLPLSTTLLDYVRYEANLRGTKIGCREGDCGACTVMIGTLNAGNVEYRSITSCLTPIANVHGKHVVTVEGLNLDRLNKVQRAMVNHSGTQCGFCTPGFITSLCAFAIQATNRPEISEAISSIDGNVCRCTGYKSIERAAGEIAEDLKNKDEVHPLEWLVMNEYLPDYFLSVKEKLATLPKQEYSGGKIAIGGGTDIYVQKFDDVESIEMKYLFGDTSLKGITCEDGNFTIGGCMTMTDFMESEVIGNAIPGWHGFLKLVASTPVRNIATVAGNLVNASPIGDLTIILLALDARIVLQNAAGEVRELFLKDFYKGYKQLNMEAGEIVNQIRFRLPEKDTLFSFEKVSKRTYLDIASVNTALCIHTKGTEIMSANCSAGGVSPVPLYLRKVSSALTGNEISPELIRQTSEILADEISPISDARGSAEYKKLLARQLFFSHFVRMFPDKIKMTGLI